MIIFSIFVWWYVIGWLLWMGEVLNYNEHIKHLQNPYKKAIAAFLGGPFHWVSYLMDWLNQP